MDVLNLHKNGYLSRKTLNPFIHKNTSLIFSFFKALINRKAFLKDKTFKILKIESKSYVFKRLLFIKHRIHLQHFYMRVIKQHGC